MFVYIFFSLSLNKELSMNHQSAKNKHWELRPRADVHVNSINAMHLSVLIIT